MIPLVDPDEWYDRAVQEADDAGSEAGRAGKGPDANPYLGDHRESWLAKYWEESRQHAARKQ